MGTPAPKLVVDLAERFDRDREVFQSPDYKEEQLRLEFLNPFFEFLGWDIYNKQGLSEFSVMPADVLGQVYEQFLGKVNGSQPAIRPRSTKRPVALFPPVHLTGRPPLVNYPRCSPTPARH